MARRSTNRELYLVALRGETEPEELKLDRARLISVGRTGNVRIHDPLVSIHHAKLYYDMEERSWVVEDLGSANGTFVNGECVRGEARLVRKGTELRFGDTVFEIRVPRRSFAWVRPLLLAVPLMVLLVVLLRFVLELLSGRPESAGEVALPEPVTIPSRGRIEAVPIDAEFLWDHGISTNLKGKEVTELRDRQSDLVWFEDHGRGRTVVVTFDQDQRWQLLGDLPVGGQVGDARETVFPSYELLGGGETWHYDEARGMYRAASQKGLVVWYRKMPAAQERDPEQPFSPPQELEPLEVGRFPVKGEPDRLSLFLSERNVQTPVHYIVCEGAFPGVRAQVLTYEGIVEELQPACIRSLTIEGLEDVVPVAIALDPVGYRALIDDLTTFYAGDPSGLFLPAELEDLVDRLKADPGTYKGGVKLVVNSGVAIPPPFRPYPAPGAELTEERQMVPNDDDKTAGKAAPSSRSQRLPYPGLEEVREVLIPTDGCEQLKVVTRGQFQPASIVGAWAFADVWSVGCGDDRFLFSVPYATDTTVHVDPTGTDVAVRVEMDSDRVRTAIIAWRP